MNLKLQKLIVLFNERKTFFNNHPESYKFIRKTFEKKLPEGTEIEIIVRSPKGEATSTTIEIQKADKKFMDSLSDILSN